MIVEMRYYKRFDPDLLALLDAGVNLNAYLPEILQAYARGQEYHLFVPFSKSHDMNGQQLIHARVTLTDDASIRLLKDIKHGYRNTFCKVLIRDALVYQNLGVFFAEPDRIRKETIRIHGKDLSGYENLVTAKVKKSRRSAASRVLVSGASKEEAEKKRKTGPEKASAAEAAVSVPAGPSLKEQREELMRKLAAVENVENPVEKPEEKPVEEPVVAQDVQEEQDILDEIPSFDEVERMKQETAGEPAVDEDEVMSLFSQMIGP